MAFGSGISSNYEDILKTVSSEQLLQRYFNIVEIPCVINAPYRKDDNPSLSIFVSKSGNIKFMDFATKETGGIVDLLMKIWRTDFGNTVRRIYNDFKGNEDTELQTRTRSLTKTKRIVSSSNIDVKVREWRDYDLEFWELYGISLPWLQFGDVYPISRIFFIDDNGNQRVYPAEKYAYCYVEYKDGLKTLKIYQPYSKVRKWMSKHNSSVWDLWSKLPDNGPQLIITSSRKDALCLWENTGIPTTSLQGEGYMPKDKIVGQLQARFKEIYVLYDNDFKSDKNYGRIDAQKICEKFNLIQLELPEKYGCKDPSDFVKMHGRKALYDIINELINETKHKLDT